MNFLVLDLPVARDGEIVPVLFDLAERNKETLSLPVYWVLFLPCAEVRDDIRNIPFPVNERPLVRS